MDFILQRILPLLPPNLQAIILNPPSLSNPASFGPIIKTILPYSKYIVVLTAIWIVWTAVTSFVGYFSRMLRFSLRIGPILALIAWLMAGSGQGGMNELFSVIKQYTGLAPQEALNGLSPGIASLVNMFGGDTSAANKRKTTRRKNPTGGSSGSDRVSGRTRGKKTAPNDGNDLVNDILKSAAGLAGVDANGGWQDAIQDYVKNAVVKSAGLDWLLGQKEEAKEEKSSWWRSR